MIETAEAETGAQAREPCGECATAPGGPCEDHGRDLDLIGEYERAARQLGAGQDCQQPAGVRS